MAMANRLEKTRSAARAAMDKRTVDRNGFWTCPANPVTRAGVFEYAAWQIGAPGNPDRVVKVYRSPESITSPKFLESLKLIPIIDEHTMLTGDRAIRDDTPADEVPMEGVTGEQVGVTDIDGIPHPTVNLKLFTEAIKNLIDAGKLELSLGYDCAYIESAGVCPITGESYEYEQVDQYGNHLALVDAGRAGHTVRVLDSKNPESAAGRRRMAFDSAVFIPIQTLEYQAMSKRKQKMLAALDSARKRLMSAKDGDDVSIKDATAAIEALAPALEVVKEMTEGGEGEGEVAELGTDDELQTGGQTMDGDGDGEQATDGDDGDGTNAEDGEGTNSAEAQRNMSNGQPATDEEGEGQNAEDADADGAQDADGAGEKGEGMDAALSRFYADASRKAALYGRASKVTGSFDHSTMTCAQMARKACAKLGVALDKKADPVAALDSALKLAEAMAGRATAARKTKAATDSAAPSSFVSNFLGGK